ncbi:MAG: sigma-70 family RNA polymerase sigma factor [Alphaproteobacteria bacterium]|nr:sigma-70 family RNA polymerase sigma factor [Alphaproteobacteria bacterium]
MTDRADLETMLARTGLGDRDAFEAMYNATSAKLFGVCLRVLKNRSEAEDTLQEVYLRIWDAAVGFRPGAASPMSWMITIARNRAIDRLRARKPVTETSTRADGTDLLADLADDAPGPEQVVLAGEVRAQVLRCFEELPEDRAIAVRRAYLDGDSYADLARHFDVPMNTMRTWLRRSLLKLRDCLSR